MIGEMERGQSAGQKIRPGQTYAKLGKNAGVSGLLGALL
jgi:hypothetical protein